MVVGANVHDVRSANLWLKRSGYGHLIKVSSKQDECYGKIYMLNFVDDFGCKKVIYQSLSLNDVIEQAAQIMMTP